MSYLITDAEASRNVTPNTTPTGQGRVTPNWLKALYAILAALVIIVTVSVIFAP